jgi:putative transposase
MVDASEIRHGRHVVSSIHAHLVFIPKYRRSIFASKHLSRMKEIFGEVCESFGATLVELNGEPNHVHLLVEYPPHIAISRLVNSLKGVSSRLLRKEFPGLSPHYYRRVLWSPSYFVASCGGAPLSIIKQYIERQAGAGRPAGAR